jgi:hypothetical protein
LTPVLSRLDRPVCKGFSAVLSRLSVIERPTLRSTSSKRLPSTTPREKALTIDLPKLSEDRLRDWVSRSIAFRSERRPPDSIPSSSVMAITSFDWLELTPQASGKASISAASAGRSGAEPRKRS